MVQSSLFDLTSHNSLKHPLLLLAALMALPSLEAAATEAPEEWRASCFVFRDINRDGAYDLGDRPFSGLLVELERPDGSVAQSWSNIDGFANFEMRLNDYVNSSVVAPGPYHARAFLPAGWAATTPSSLEQQVTFVSKPAAGSGLVPQQPCRHIGIAPHFVVAGQVLSESGNPNPNIKVSARNGSGVTTPIKANADGFYDFEASPGMWEVTATDTATGKSTVRKVQVGNAGLILSAIVPGRNHADPEAPGAKTANFDDLMTSDAILEIPSGYEGLNWSYWVATNNRFYEGEGYINATVSGDFVAYNSSGVPATISRAEPFDFRGTYVTAAWPRGETDGLVTVQGWRKGEVIYEDTFKLWNAGGVYFQADYSQVDKVTFSHSIYERIVIDNLSYR